MSHGIKVTNGYSAALGRFYTDTPKAVFAAIASSFADRLVAEAEREAQSLTIVDLLNQEWQVLHDNGIVPQEPGK